MTVDRNGDRPTRNTVGHWRRVAKLALPTGAALVAGGAISAIAAGDSTTPQTTTSAAAAVFPRAASSYFLKIEGIKGESQDTGTVGDINVDSFSFGDEAASANPLGARGAGAGRVHFDDLTIKKDVDSASAPLFEDSVSGQHLSDVELIAVRDGGSNLKGDASQTYLKIDLTNVIVTSYNLSSQEPAGEGEVETITLEFQKINYEYLPQNADGTTGTPVNVGWNISNNKAS